MNSYLSTFLNEHAISDEIGGHGRYVPFGQGDVDLVASHFAGFGGKLERFARNVAGQEGGLVIKRVGWEMDIPPQLRPENPVFGLSAPALSFHPDDLSVKGCYYTTAKGKRRWVPALPCGQRDRHIAKWHPDGNVQGVHLHHPRAKYAIPPGLHGKRLDVPMPDRIVCADRVFFVIEGSVKTDAILSAGEAAFGVPSVTLWDAPELDGFLNAMRLHEKQVVVVPDADWVDNPLVSSQAWLLRTYLRERGVAAVVAAPPLLGGRIMVDPVFGALKGVDDFLAAGHSLDELAVLERETDRSVAGLAVFERCWGGMREMTRARDALVSLPLYADDDGRLYRNISAFGRILGCGRERARNAIADLARLGLIEVEGGLEADFQYQDKQTGTWHNYDWTERPLITFAPEFRASQRLVPLRDFPTIRHPTREATLVHV